MSYRIPFILLFAFVLLCSAFSCSSKGEDLSKAPVAYLDEPFEQEYAIKYHFEQELEAKKVNIDRNGVVEVLTSEGIYRCSGGAFLYPGKLQKSQVYWTLNDKLLKDAGLYKNQFIYLDEKAVLSNAWAGELYEQHAMEGPSLVAGGKDFGFLVTAGKQLKLLKGEEVLFQAELPEACIALHYGEKKEKFYLLTSRTFYEMDENSGKLEKLFEGEGLSSFDLTEGEDKAVIGSYEGYLSVELASKKASKLNANVPWPKITHVKNIAGNLWFGSEKGAFMLKKDGSFNYYFGERWLLGEEIVDISSGENGEVFLLTDQGLSKLVFQRHTLYDKAMYFEEQVRNRHIRFGFNSSLGNMEKGNVDSGRLKDSDNDGLWTSMYLAGQAFRYAVNPSEEALENIKESLNAMERLYTINPVEGFPSRSFNRSGYQKHLSDPERWQRSEHPEWDWKATTSSDEAIGHVFVFGVIAELVDDKEVKEQAVQLLDGLMKHILKHDYYLVDFDGKPTLWGKWNPDYVNGFPSMVGDRKLNSSNIIAMLQTAYHFTEDELYKEKAFELMEQHGYFDNLMVPMERIGKAEGEAGQWAEMLSEAWNHSDDEMYFLGYWGLYRYAFNDTLKNHYAEAIRDHWQAERPEKDGLWNIMTAIVSPEDFDQEEAIWYLKEYPMDLINWTMVNSHRKDLTLLEQNFRNQYTKTVLPPDELMIRRHNANRFALDGGSDGSSESSAGDIWLLPYWMGRYLGVISGPQAIQ
ncbi:hypothetical protein GCM10028791_08610 [Echinicola sediminis]